MRSAPNAGERTDALRWQLTAIAKRTAAGALGTLLQATGTDRTAETARRSCLVVAPHPDDETLGCAATMMRKIGAGTAVSVVVASGGGGWPPESSSEVNVGVRAAELAAARKVLGLSADNVTSLDLPDGHLAADEGTIADALADALRSGSFDDVLATSPTDPHPDHAAVGRAAASVTAGAGARLLCYPIWQWERPRPWLRLALGSSRPELVSTSGYLDRKRATIDCYKSQLADLSDANFGLSPAFLARFTGKYEIFFPQRH